MEIRQLRHFLALMETRSYWRAARHCEVTPQALSKSIRRFEESIGVRLFDRDTRSVRPTLFADEIHGYARAIDAEANSLARALDSLLDTGTNRLVIGTGAAAATQLVGRTVTAVLAQRPRLSVHVVEGNYESLMPQLMNGRLDVVVSIMTTDSVDRLIEHRVLQVERYRVFARAGHPLASTPRVSLKQLLDYPWIAGDDEDIVADEVKASFVAAGLEAPNPALRTNSVAFGTGLALQSDALFVLPAEMVSREVASHQIVPIDVDAKPWSRPTAVFFRRNSTRSSDSLLFLQELKKAVEDLPP